MTDQSNNEIRFQKQTGIQAGPTFSIKWYDSGVVSVCLENQAQSLWTLQSDRARWIGYALIAAAGNAERKP